MRRVAWVVILAAVVAAGGWYAYHELARCPGCHTLDAHRTTWRDSGITDYSYVYEDGGMACCYRARVTVRGGRVVRVRVLEHVFTVANPTVDDVFARARHEMHVADHVDVVYDRRYGFPSSVSVDPKANVTDDEYGFRITQFRPLRPAAS